MVAHSRPRRWPPPPCSRASSPAAAPRRTRARTTTLTVPADTQITTFNPFLSYYDGELNIIGDIYPTLTMLDDKGKPVPYLADSWTTSADKLTWTFKIQPG